MISHRQIALLVLTAGLVGCGLPESPNVGAEFARNINYLGVFPIYPMRDSVRLGDVYVVDQSFNPDKSALPTDVATEFVTSDLSSVVEKHRSKQIALSSRFPKSPDKLQDQISPGSNGRSYYRQPDPGKGDATSLDLAGMPGYSVASLTDFAGSGSASGLFAGILTSLGFRRTATLNVEPQGVEIAQVPLDLLSESISEVCHDPKTPFGNPAGGKFILALANNIELARYEDRAKRLHGTPKKSYEPKILIVSKVYYLRGIKYTYNDSEAISAALSAALKNSFPQGSTPVFAPNVEVKVDGAANGGGTNKDLTALEDEVGALRKSIVGSGNNQLALSFARATAVGIELTDLFERPLAFGYDAYVLDLPIGPDQSSGASFDEFCRMGLASEQSRLPHFGPHTTSPLSAPMPPKFALPLSPPLLQLRPLDPAEK